jgi:hypothetical protein
MFLGGCLSIVQLVLVWLENRALALSGQAIPPRCESRSISKRLVIYPNFCNQKDLSGLVCCLPQQG